MQKLRVGDPNSFITTVTLGKVTLNPFILRAAKKGLTFLEIFF